MEARKGLEDAPHPSPLAQGPTGNTEPGGLAQVTHPSLPGHLHHKTREQ